MTSTLNYVSCAIYVQKSAPTEAIVMTNNFELAEYNREDLFKDIKWLSENMRTFEGDKADKRREFIIFMLFGFNGDVWAVCC